MVRAKEGALAALDTDVGPVLILIPEDGSDDTGIAAEAASCASVRIQADSPCGDLFQGCFGAGLHTGSVLTAAADDDRESFAHPSGRKDTDGRVTQPAVSRASGAGIHAKLAAYA